MNTETGTEITTETDREITRALRDSANWYVALGIAMMILGIFAVANPMFATLTANLVLGWIFLLAGVIKLIHSFKTRAAGPFVIKVLISFVYIFLGIFLFKNPFVGAVPLTLLVGIFLFLDGAFRVIAAFQVKPLPGWGWTLFNGMVTIILSILIWSEWPFNAPWVIGLLVGVRMFINGISTVMGALAARKSFKEA